MLSLRQSVGLRLACFSCYWMSNVEAVGRNLTSGGARSRRCRGVESDIPKGWLGLVRSTVVVHGPVATDNVNRRLHMDDSVASLGTARSPSPISLPLARNRMC
jgi:hypothetical protein